MMEKDKNIIGLKNKIEEFVEKVAQREEDNYQARLKLEQLKEIAYGVKEEYRSTKQRYVHLERWFSQEGMELSSRGLNRSQLEEIVRCIEEVKRCGASVEVDQENKTETELRDRVLKRCNAFIRNGTKKLGLEYTLLGLMEVAWVEEDKLRVMEGMRSELIRSRDLKSEYQEFLSYQNQLLGFFFKPQEHLLSILDHQLKTLEVRHSDEDEFFVSCLVEFVKLKKYHVAPYVERFKKLISTKIE